MPPDEQSKRRPGRPRVHQEPRRDFHLALPEDLLAALDEAAGDEGRSAYIERLLKRELKVSDKQDDDQGE